MPGTNVRLETADRIATLTIDRPKQLNALDEPTIREILRALRELRREGVARCLVVTGAGEKAFCAGADIEAMRSLSPAEARDFARLGQRMTLAFEELSLPVIAAVNGFALGGGMELAMACDLVVASTKARFGQPEIRLGILPGFGGTQRLVRRVGPIRARELVYLGGQISAETAVSWGLANRAVAPGELQGAVDEWARELAARAPIALGQCKNVLSVGPDVDLGTGLRYEAEAFGLAFSTEDRERGMAAFLEKRPAEFVGK